MRFLGEVSRILLVFKYAKFNISSLITLFVSSLSSMLYGRILESRIEFSLFPAHPKSKRIMADIMNMYLKIFAAFYSFD